MIFIYVLLAFAIIPLLLGLLPFFIAGKPKEYHSPTLLFHSIQPDWKLRLSYYPTDKFNQFCERLKVDGYNCATISQLDLRQSKAQLSKRQSAILFDDGLRDVFCNAMPILMSFGQRATVFPVSGFIGKYAHWDVFTPPQHCTAEEIRSLADNGFEIGSHTHTHPDLLFLNERDLEYELRSSKEILESIAKTEVTALSFPFGRWNLRVWEKAQKYGYRVGVTYQPSNNCPGIISINGAYSYDSVDDLMTKVAFEQKYSATRACSRIMTHFAKGTPIWKFRPNYSLHP